MDDAKWLDLACELAVLCPPSLTAFSVGAVIVGSDGDELARGFSREGDPTVHAEESALAKIPGVDLGGATIYSSLEPCAHRASRPKPCARLILEAGIGRVVFAWREPSLFVPGDGYEELTGHGVEVVELPGFEEKAKAPNLHLVR